MCNLDFAGASSGTSLCSLVSTGGYIEPEEGGSDLYRLRDDPRRSGVHDYLAKQSSQALRPVINQAYKHSGKHIEEEFNVVWAQHELTSEYIGDIVDWLANPKA